MSKQVKITLLNGDCYKAKNDQYDETLSLEGVEAMLKSKRLKGDYLEYVKAGKKAYLAYIAQKRVEVFEAGESEAPKKLEPTLKKF